MPTKQIMFTRSTRRKNTILHLYLRHSSKVDSEVVQQFIDVGVKLSIDSKVALIQAAENLSTTYETYKILIRATANINLVNLENANVLWVYI